MFLGVRIFIFFAKATENKDRTTNLSNICRCFYLSVFIHLLPIFFTNKHLVIAFFLILKSNKIEQNPTCLHCIENTELVG